MNINLRKIITIACALTAAFQGLRVDAKKFEFSENPFLRECESGNNDKCTQIKDIGVQDYKDIEHIAVRRYQNFDNTMEFMLRKAGFNNTASVDVINYAKSLPKSAERYNIRWFERVNYYSNETLSNVWKELRHDAAKWINQKAPELSNLLER